MSDRDRTEICNIISEMLDNPNKYGIYPTGRAYDKLEKYMERKNDLARLLIETTYHEFEKSSVKLPSDVDQRTQEKMIREVQDILKKPV